MDAHVQHVFLFEVAKQCQFGVNAHAGLRNVLARLQERPSNLDSDTRNTLHNEVIRSLHSLLAHAGVVSRILWPPAPKKGAKESAVSFARRVARHDPTKRAASLRTAVGLPDKHPLRSRELRDHLEHLDERLDAWAREGGGSIVQDLIGPPSAISGVAPSSMFRCYDPGSDSFTFRGATYSIGDIARELEGIADACIPVLVRAGFMSSVKLMRWDPTGSARAR